MTIKEVAWMIIGALIAAAIGTAVAQRGPNDIPGCIAHASPPAAATEGAAIPLQCDLSGHLRTTVT